MRETNTPRRAGLQGQFQNLSQALALYRLYEFLEQPTPQPTGYADRGLRPGEGLRFEAVSFTYPGNPHLALACIIHDACQWALTWPQMSQR